MFDADAELTGLAEQCGCFAQAHPLTSFYNHLPRRLAEVGGPTGGAAVGPSTLFRNEQEIVS